MKRWCIVNNDIPFASLLAAAATAAPTPSLEEQMKSYLGVAHLSFASNGFTALYAILLALKERYPDRTEIIIPAYTASGLVLPIQKAGLTVRLCDVSLETFTMDPALLPALITRRTLAVIPVHMFGLPADIAAVNKAVHDTIPVIEDCAQALGTEIGKKHVGRNTIAAIGSFARGKNFSLYHGGFAATNDRELSVAINKYIRTLPSASIRSQYSALLRLLAFSFLIQPDVYAISASLLARLKPTKEQSGFVSAQMHPLLQNLGACLFKKWITAVTRRIENGRTYYHALNNIRNVLTFPAYSDGSVIAYNRFPVLIKDPETKQKIMRALAKTGVESSVMYGKPVFGLWDIGYTAADCPNAQYMADHLLTLPVYGQMQSKDIERIADILL
jgi:dTDP-4-amino-4,6-dideoxygalactose transaminase